MKWSDIIYENASYHDPNKLWYHGGESVFDKFDPAYAGTKLGSSPGFWFTDNPDLVGFYGHVHFVVKLRVQNPKIISEQAWEELDKRSPAYQARLAASEDYDALILEHVFDGDRQATNICVFDAEDIAIVSSTDLSENASMTLREAGTSPCPYYTDQQFLLIKLMVENKIDMPYPLIPFLFLDAPAPKGFKRIKPVPMDAVSKQKMSAFYHFSTGATGNDKNYAMLYANMFAYEALFPDDFKKWPIKMRDIFDFEPRKVNDLAAYIEQTRGVHNIRAARNDMVSITALRLIQNPAEAEGFFSHFGVKLRRRI
jgi:hypothetical protein